MPFGTIELAGPPAVLASEFRAEPPADQTVVVLRIMFTFDLWRKSRINGVRVRTARDVETLLNHELRW